MKIEEDIDRRCDRDRNRTDLRYYILPIWYDVSSLPLGPLLRSNSRRLQDYPLNLLEPKEPCIALSSAKYWIRSKER